ncbi:MAG: sigma-70 family RNA polymerase sigma factor [Lentisphaerae bacterium]|nr:sigma-70 family RNA polymerase sigma factor [Lentisphaerota bacterium]
MKSYYFSGNWKNYTTHTSFLERVKSGSEEAWNEFFNKYSGMIRDIGKKRNLSHEDCDDLMVEVMTIFWQKLDTFFYDRERGKFRSYLSKIANLSAFRIFNRNNKTPESAVLTDAEYPAEVDALFMKEWQDFLLQKAMDEVKDSVDTEVWQAFYMSSIQNRPVEEVAKITRKSANNIYVIRSRITKKLQKLIASYKEAAENELAGNSARND